LLETTAGQGSNLGHRFRAPWRESPTTFAEPERVAVCRRPRVNLFAAGVSTYDEGRIHGDEIAELDRVVGLGAGFGGVFTSTTGVRELGSPGRPGTRRIGPGKLGLKAVSASCAQTNPRLRVSSPMYPSRQPKGEVDGEQLDAVNMRTPETVDQEGP